MAQSNNDLISLEGKSLPMLSSGEPALRLVGIAGSEGISRLYRYLLDCVTPSRGKAGFEELANLDLAGLVGTELTVGIALEKVSKNARAKGFRQISGVVTEAYFQGAGERNCRYRLVIEPWLHLAEHRTDFRIFQNQSVLCIVRSIVETYGWTCEFRLSSDYPDLIYQVQYGESDFAFAQRLMQEHGIYWFFEHADHTHYLVLVDAKGAHRASPFISSGVLPYHPDDSSTVQEYINSFHFGERIQASSWRSADFNFETPHTTLDVEARAARPHPRYPLQQYVWPGDHASFVQGQRFADIRMQELSARNERYQGAGPLRGILCGTTFGMEGHPRQRANQDYLVIEATLDVRVPAGVSGSGECQVACSFIVQPACMPFRPPLDIPKPRTAGPQTAVVTGPPGNDVWTDQYGRVKVRFHWDRAGESNQNSSCWIRVAFPWAGSQFGSVAIPRVGSEVIVDFENGDPDRPIITGSVYNAANMPPWSLPENSSQSGTCTRSTPGGEYELSNAIRFEDKAGAEQVWLHAQRNLLTDVGNDEIHSVAANRARNTGGNETTSIGGERSIVVQGGEQHTVSGARTVSVEGSQNLSVGSTLSFAVGSQLSFVCGASSIVMNAGGAVTISGVDVTVVAAGTLVTQAPMTNLKSG
ncbi:type VI secretion system Vgr family protein [Pseudomonas nicosulfuronedens]